MARVVMQSRQALDAHVGESNFNASLDMYTEMNATSLSYLAGLSE